MKTYAQTLIADLDHKLEYVHQQSNEPLEYSEQAVAITITFLEKLKTFFMKYKFQSKFDEIDFFREIKPQFASRLIFYNDVYNIELNKPLGVTKDQRKYYSAELGKLKDFFNDNCEFYKYYRTGNRYLDTKYFIRGKHDIRLTLDSSYFQADHRFSTSHDYKVAQILANDRIKGYLEEQLNALSNKFPEYNTATTVNSQKWTGSKVALTELVYALHADGVFNNGTSDLKDIAAFFETSFQVDLGHFHRTFLDIRSRTSERTKFLNGLRDKLIVRMDNADD